MKIGILTQPLHSNYGGLLQNYALQQVLLRAGHEVETINQDPPLRSPLRLWAGRCKVAIYHSLMPQRYAKPRYVPSETEMGMIRRNTNQFINTYIRHTKTIHSSHEFSSIAKANGYEAFVVGSDQCWRPKYNSYLLDMFLQFVEERTDIRRIAYAASFGTDEWEMTESQTASCARLAQLFDLVTVREDCGVQMCHEHFGVKSTHVVDPTLLLDQADYVHLVEQEHETKSSGTLFEYILDPTEEKTAFVNRIATEMKLTPFHVMPEYQTELLTRQQVKGHLADCVYPRVTTWLRAFMDAEMTIVDSFHGMVFSILFNKPFWVIGNERRGLSRFTSLLHLFDLENRLISSNSIACVNICQPVNWSFVNDKRRELQSFSSKLLLQALE